MPLVAIAILNWNGKKWLEKFLPNVLEYSDEATVYVIDNASTDDSVAFVEKYFPTVKSSSMLKTLVLQVVTTKVYNI